MLPPDEKMIPLPSKLPHVGTTIFTVMSALAQEYDALNLAQGFPDFPPHPGLCDALGRATHKGANQYAPLAGYLPLREAIAEQLYRYRGVTVHPADEITVVPGATEGIFCSVMATVAQGDEVIILEPAYDSYAPAIELAGGVVCRVSLDLDTFRPNWARVAAAITPRTKMIILNSPHNPSGSVLGEDDMRALEALVLAHNLYVCSDEVYEFLTFDGRPHCCALQYPALRERAFVHFSFGKTFGVTGWKTGYCVAPPALMQEFRKIHQYVAFVAVTPVQHALADFMHHHPDYPEGLSRFYQDKRDLFLSGLAGSRMRFTPSEGTYFQLLDYYEVARGRDNDVAIEWTQHKRLASIPLSSFYQRPPPQSLLRFCFAKSDTVLREAAEILCQI
jgi:methionine aminotransferase